MKNSYHIFYNFEYIFGRLLSVVFKPLLIFTASNFLSDSNVSVDISICFLLVPLSQVLVSFDPHRNYYISYIKNESFKRAKEFKTYLINFIALAFFSLFYSGIILYFFLSVNFIFVIIILLYLLSEKLIDENLRFHIFNKNFRKWSSINIIRFIMSLLILIILFLFFRRISAEFIIIVVTFCNFIALKSYFLDLKLFKFFKGISSEDIMVASSVLKNHIYIWLSSLLTISISYSDRLFILLSNTEKLPSISLAVACFSLIQIGIEFFYISNYRSEFLENKMTLKNTLFGRHFLLIFLFFLCLSCFSYYMVYYFSLAKNKLNLTIIFSVLVTQIAVAINIVPQQILYWKSQYGKLISSDIFFWILFSLVLLFNIFIFDINLIYFLFSIIFLIRTFLNLHFSS